MFFKTPDNSRNRKGRKKNASNQQIFEQKYSKDIIWIGIGILIIVIIEIFTGEDYFSTTIDRTLQLLETIRPQRRTAVYCCVALLYATFLNIILFQSLFLCFNRETSVQRGNRNDIRENPKYDGFVFFNSKDV